MTANNVLVTKKQKPDYTVLSARDDSLRMRVAGVAPESTVDGPGYRYVVFTQGCPHQCAGCHNPETHDFSGGKLTSVGRLLEEMTANPLLAGLTISGGEPFCQAGACAALAQGARAAGLHVIVYSGYTLDELQAMEDAAVSALLCVADWLVDGRFMHELRTPMRRFAGSSNQRVIDLPKTLLAKEIFLVGE